MIAQHFYPNPHLMLSPETYPSSFIAPTKSTTKSFATMTSTANATVPTGARKPAKAAALPAETVDYLKAWMMSPEHVAHPYPTEQEKALIMADTGIELKQLTNWFVNNRKRFWKPAVEAKLQKHSACALPSSHQQVTGTGTGGLRISMLRLNPKFQQATSSIATLYNNAANFGPAAEAVNAVAASHEDDPHTISASSSACNSDDDSADASGSCNDRTSFGATATQYLDSHLASVASSSSITSTTAIPYSGHQRHEEVDVHVLRPDGFSALQKGYSVDSEGILPSLRELTIKSSISKERILATFKCRISYSVPLEIQHDPMKVRSRRNSEVLRVKKHYLNLYLATRRVHSVSSLVGSNVRVPIVTPSSSASSVLSTVEPSAAAAPSTVHAISPLKTPSTPVQMASSSRTRAFASTHLGQDDSNSNPAPRKRARKGPRSLLLKGEEKWRKLCQSADDLYCESLPGLDDAARMFGYVSS